MAKWPLAVAPTTERTNYPSVTASNLNSTDDMNLTKTQCYQRHGGNSASRRALLVGRAGGDTLGKNSKHWQHSTRPTSPILVPTPSMLTLAWSFFTSPILSTSLWHSRIHLSLCHTSIDIHSKPGSSNHSSHTYRGPPWLYLYPAGLIWRRALAVG